MNECEQLPSPCSASPATDVWCVNTPGSYSCCSSNSGCSGLDIVSEDSLKDKGHWKTVSYGEWKNFTGGQLIIGRRRVLPDTEEWGLELTGRGINQFEIPEESDSKFSKSTPTTRI